MSDERVYCIWDPTRGKWWNPRGLGYTGNLIDAGVYKKSSAKRICDDSHTHEQMYLKSNLMQSQTLRNKIYDAAGV